MSTEHEYWVPDHHEELVFHCPDDINQILSLVNELFDHSLSLVDTDGTVYGWFTDQKLNNNAPVSHMNNETGKIVLMTGEINLGITFDSISDAKNFVKGMFFFAFYFKKISDIEHYLSSRKIVEVSMESLAVDWMKFMTNSND